MEMGDRNRGKITFDSREGNIVTNRNTYDKNLGRIFPRSSIERRTTSHMLTFLLAGYLC